LEGEVQVVEQLGNETQILVFKFVGANILRVWLNFEERRNPSRRSSSGISATS
ncbi:hypothetical protein O5165_25470, partial [Escherichia coli]|nr:hypothetical protein [Escherichia coli]